MARPSSSNKSLLLSAARALAEASEASVSDCAATLLARRAISEHPFLEKLIPTVATDVPLRPCSISTDDTLHEEVAAFCYHKLADQCQYLSGEAVIRKRRGAYFTPPEAVDTLLEAVIEELQGAGRVVDPACGSGAFLREFLRSSSTDPSEVRDALRERIYGVDIDPLAVFACRLGLLVTAADHGYEPEIADLLEVCKHIRLGDSVLAAPFDCSPIHTESWQNWFPKVAACGGFDAVVGNPPFANRIAKHVDQRVIDAGKRFFPELSGNADLAAYFLACAHRLARPTGQIAFVLPRPLLGAPAAAELRMKINQERPMAKLWLDQQRLKSYGGAEVYTVLAYFHQHDQLIRVFRDDEEGEHTESADNWWHIVETPPNLNSLSKRKLSEVFDVRASMTATDAYNLKPLIYEGGEGLRLMTTGLIDPGASLWGKRRCRYLGVDWNQPRVRFGDGDRVSKSLRRRLIRARRPKVIVAGLSSRPEAFFDTRGECAGAVSTYSIYSPDDNTSQLSELCDFLNGDLVAALFRAELGASAMAAGNITMRKGFMQNLRLPAAFAAEKAEER